MDLQITIPSKETKKTMTVKEEIFGCPLNEALVHQVVTAYLAGGRSGSVKQKSRSEVAGSTKKEWRQKGTGRARAGAGKVNIWRSGGMAFPARPADYSQKINKKMYHSALRSIVSQLVRDDRLVVIESFKLDTLKTKELMTKLKEMAIDNALIITDEVDDQVSLASRNIPTVDACDIRRVNPVSLLSFEKVIITEPAVRQLEEWLA